ncbi:unnamed protein product [Thlaspi arvense]|uniref:AAA+ ATPase domain-containing protein n=1 Tax=Thlaspi arvense TaxID=13288 RepID=A0AAU9RX22_THLAR|nr:unnamed protein product [Thlaspi arvense]
MVVSEYVKYVMEEGIATVASNRQLKLYSNCCSEGGDYWNYMKDFDNSAAFDTLAMEKNKKQDIIEDLVRFSNAREYYRRIGKPWKRGYLLFGPPGTGKSTMIAVMANFLSYDIYDLELTAVLSNAALKRLLNRTPCNSILVIEDIDCSSNVTDGLFSASEGGRLIVFTTNRVENLDPALIRKGRMDKHIEMLYCSFEAFKVLARNYLGIVEHELFPKIEGLLREIDIAPADVAENLITGTTSIEGSTAVAAACLQNLIEVLEKKAESNSSGAEEKGEGDDEDEAPKENGNWILENGYVNSRRSVA